LSKKVTARKKLTTLKSDISGAEYGLCEDEKNTRAGCAALKVENLQLHYGKTPAFQDISMTFAPCAITSIVGPSGCGKTSFLKSLNRLIDLIPEASLKGKIQMGQVEISSTKCDTHSLRKRVGMIFQKPSPFPFSIRKNIALPLQEHGVSKKDIDEKIEKALRDVGLWGEVQNRLNESACNLSGGQQQRLCIARAIALEPEIILMDEPCSALDPISSGVVEELILSLRGNYTVVVVTHNLAQAKRISDNVAFFWLKNGTGALIEHGSVEKIFNSPEHELTESYISGARG